MSRRHTLLVVPLLFWALTGGRTCVCPCEHDGDATGGGARHAQLAGAGQVHCGSEDCCTKSGPERACDCSGPPLPAFSTVSLAADLPALAAISLCVKPPVARPAGRPHVSRAAVARAVGPPAFLLNCSLRC